jgi:predicted transcriptional regulator YheO
MLLESYKSTIDGLAAYLGDAFEIVLHSLDDLEHSTIKIVNGHHSGRKEGSPITDLALSMLKKIEHNNSEDGEKHAQVPYLTYMTGDKYGKPVKSTTMVIFGESREGEPRRAIGLLCINLYLDSPISTLAPFLGVISEVTAPRVDENFITNSNELIYSALHKTLVAVAGDHSVSEGRRNKEVITRLYFQGIFKLKNAVPAVAERLGISKNTVYLHLRHMEKKKMKKIS